MNDTTNNFDPSQFTIGNNQPPSTPPQQPQPEPKPTNRQPIPSQSQPPSTPSKEPAIQQPAVTHPTQQSFQQPTNITLDVHTDTGKTHVDMTKTVTKHCSCNGLLKILIALIMFVVGLWYLADRSGVATIDLWFETWMVFPLIIMIGSLFLLLKGSLGKILWLLFLLWSIGWISLASIFYGTWPTTPWAGTNEILVWYQDSTSIDYDIHTTFSDIIIAGWSTFVAEWVVDTDRMLTVTDSVEWSTQTVAINEDQRYHPMQDLVWEVNVMINNQRPKTVYLKNFYGDIDVDLSDVVYSDLQIHGGIGDRSIQLSSFVDRSTVQLVWWYGNVVLSIPTDAGVKFTIKKYRWNTDLPEFNEVSKWVYQSVWFDKKLKTIDVEIDIAIGDVIINRVNPSTLPVSVIEREGEENEREDENVDHSSWSLIQ